MNARAFNSFVIKADTCIEFSTLLRYFHNQNALDHKAYNQNRQLNKGERMSFSVKVVASGVIALCLVLSAIFYIESILNPSMEALGDKFFGLAVALVFIIIILALAGVKIRLP